MRTEFLAMGLLCLLIVTGCADFENQKNEDRVSPLSQANYSDLIEARVVPSEEPEKYMVFLRWPAIDSGYRMRVRLSETLRVLESFENSFSHEVSHNQTLEYRLEAIGSTNRIERSFVKKVQIPVDLKLGFEASVLREPLQVKAKRVFIGRAFPLITNGFPVRIETETLTSDSGEIMTFPEGAKANEQADGLEPQEIIIKALVAKGKLGVRMRGQNGGDGNNGLAYDSRAAAGVPPGAGGEACKCLGPDCDKQFSLPVLMSEKPVTAASVKKPQVCYCAYIGSPGGPGADGLKGRKGGRAGRGSNTGRLTIEIQNGLDFELDVKKEKGLAGTPGKGGSGQLGGIGGRSTNPNPRNCDGPPGPEGKQGTIGETGDPAIDGNEDPVCIKIESENRNECI